MEEVEVVAVDRRAKRNAIFRDRGIRAAQETWTQQQGESSLSRASITAALWALPSSRLDLCLAGTMSRDSSGNNHSF
jgi:hypothetical protein